MLVGIGGIGVIGDAMIVIIFLYNYLLVLLDIILTILTYALMNNYLSKEH